MLFSLLFVLATHASEIHVDQVITNGEVASSIVSGVFEDGTLTPGIRVEGDFSSRSKTTQTISTTIQDSENPEEPWVVTTYRRPGESHQAFLNRHRDMVNSVRDALGGRYDPIPLGWQEEAA